MAKTKKQTNKKTLFFISISTRESTAALLPPSSTKWAGAMLAKSIHLTRAQRGSLRC